MPAVQISLLSETREQVYTEVEEWEMAEPVLQQVDPVLSPEQLFLAGYSDGGGRPEWADRFLHIITTCEGSKWQGYYGDIHWSRAQFSPDTWEKIMRHFQVTDQYAFADDPYSIGLAVAWWSSMTVPGEQWPYCWWRY